MSSYTIHKSVEGASEGTAGELKYCNFGGVYLLDRR